MIHVNGKERASQGHISIVYACTTYFILDGTMISFF